MDGETAATVEAWPATLSAWDATGELRVAPAEEGLSEVLLRMLSMVKEVGVDFAVGDDFGFAGIVCCGAGRLDWCSALSVFVRDRGGGATAVCRGKEGICTCRVSAFCCCWAESDGKAQGSVRAGRPTPGRPGRCMHEGYTDIILETASLVVRAFILASEREAELAGSRAGLELRGRRAVFSRAARTLITANLINSV